jgi:ABC-type phosphate transport system auxiliary subunit
VARLEQQIAGSLINAAHLQQLRVERGKPQVHLTAAKKSVAEVEHERDRLFAERASIQNQLAGLSSFLHPSTSSLQPDQPSVLLKPG